MNKQMMASAFFAILFAACSDSSNAGDVASNADHIDAGVSKSRGEKFADADSSLSDCKKMSQDLADESWNESVDMTNSRKDTVCIYNEFPYQDSICCFGEVGTWLQRDENGKYVNVSGDYSVGHRSDTLFASVHPFSVDRCLASVGETRYVSVKIGSQVWLSENARGTGRCLNDDLENCERFGSLMSYDMAKRACSGDYRLPTASDVDRLLRSVGGVMEISYTKDVCGELPSETAYVDVPLFTNSDNSVKNGDDYGFAFLVDGGIYDWTFDGERLAYASNRTCLYLQSDEDSDYREAFCYDIQEKKAYLTAVRKEAELYVRCIMK